MTPLAAAGILFVFPGRFLIRHRILFEDFLQERIVDVSTKTI